jgi:hypothetical protein
VSLELDSFDIFAFFVLIGIAGVLTVLYVGAKQRYDNIQADGVRVQGVVIRNKTNWGQITTVQPIIRFVTRDGQTIEAEYWIGEGFARYPEGVTVTIMYNQQNPYAFDIVNASRRYF